LIIVRNVGVSGSIGVNSTKSSSAQNVSKSLVVGFHPTLTDSTVTIAGGTGTQVIMVVSGGAGFFPNCSTESMILPLSGIFYSFCGVAGDGQSFEDFRHKRSRRFSA